MTTELPTAALRELCHKMRTYRAHTYASENADHYRGFDVGQLRAAEAIEPLLDALDLAIVKAREDEARYWYKEFVEPWKADDYDTDDKATQHLYKLQAEREALEGKGERE